jgi:hypothetical protein
MKILWLYKYIPTYNVDKWFHLDYVRWMKDNGYDITAYGPNIHDEYPDIVDVKYDACIDWNRLLELTKADVVILNTKSRMFADYSPHTGVQKGCWLPAGFEQSKAIPKIMIDEDTHYEKSGQWYKDVGIDLLLLRHYSQVSRDWGVKTQWLPFSVDTSVFRPLNRHRKYNKLCFAGHITPPYPERRIICECLSQTPYLEKFEHRQMVGDKYIACLQNYIAHLSSGSMYDICAAKNFEIMSCGSVLVTNDFSGRDLLFPAGTYYNINPNGKVVQQVEQLINNAGLIADISNAGRKCILERHTNRIRTEELLTLLKSSFPVLKTQ